MFKKIFILLIFLLIASTAQAAEFDYVRSVGVGELWSNNYVATAFYGYVGEGVVLGSATMEYLSTMGFCGLASYYTLGTLLITNFTGLDIFYILPFSDLYVYLCIKSSGLSGNFMAYILDASMLSMSQIEDLRAKQSEDEHPQELIEKLKEAFSKLENQQSQ